jgi:hypothetical protein
VTDHRLRVTVGNEDDARDVLDRLDNKSIDIVIDDVQPTWQQQLLAITLVDLLGRLFPRVSFTVNATAAADAKLPPGPTTLAERLREAHAHGGLNQQPGTGRDLVINIGGTSAADLHIDGAGWQSYLGRTPSKLTHAQDSVAIGAVAAACRAAAATSRWALTDELPDQDVYSSALTYSTATSPLDEPTPEAHHIEAYLVGAGSVGGAAVHTIAHTPNMDGSLVVIDPQSLEEHNVVRAILARADAVNRRDGKAIVAQNAVGHHAALHVVPVDKEVTTHHATMPPEATFPITLVAVDSVESRRAVQDCLPLDVVNAACHPEEVTVSVHRTDDGACICCLHMEDVLDQAKVKKRLIAQATGMPEPQVNQLLATRAPLTPLHLRRIEEFRGLQSGSLSQYERGTLLDLWEAELLYGAIPVTLASGGRAAVAAPYVTALAGVLLAAEALKASSGIDASYRLGIGGALGTKYDEHVVHGPASALLTRPNRWPTSECLCRSPRRIRLMRRRYGLSSDT